jgi:hypothetical protein
VRYLKKFIAPYVSSRSDLLQVAPSEAKYESEGSRAFLIASTIERLRMKSWSLPLVIGAEDRDSGVRANSHIIIVMRHRERSATCKADGIFRTAERHV